MKNFKDLLTEAYDLASIKKGQWQRIGLAILLFGISMYLLWTDKIPNVSDHITGFSKESMTALLVTILCAAGVSVTVIFLFEALPIGRIRVKSIRKYFLLLYHDELSRLEENKSDAEKNIDPLEDRCPRMVSSREEDRLIKANNELQRFHQEVDPYVIMPTVRPDIASYIR